MIDLAGSDGERLARRFLHICYCWNDNDELANFFVDALAMKVVMATPLEPSDGAILGIDGEVISAATFVYDWRGPRTSPGLELQDWQQPSLIGEPPSDPTAVGAQALGFAVAELDTGVRRLVAAGCREVGRGMVGDRFTVTFRDPRGVGIDLYQDDAVPAGSSRLAYLRITASDLGRSVPWYETIGFAVNERGVLERGDAFGIPDPVDAEIVRLGLPDEECEVVLVEWRSPAGHGRHPARANEAGLFRAAVGVDDTREATDRMERAGVVFQRAPRLVELHGTPVPDMWISFLDDPDGVAFEFVQRPRSAFRPAPSTS